MQVSTIIIATIIIFIVSIHITIWGMLIKILQENQDKEDRMKNGKLTLEEILQLENQNMA